MNTKTLSQRALSVIDQYQHFTAGTAVCSVPYFNNKTVRARAAMRAEIGKASPQEILDEVKIIAVKNHIDLNALADESLKKLLVDNNLGIDCSGFAYYVLNAESDEKGKGHLDKHINFVNCHGLLGKFRCSIRPIENCDVSTFANDKNSEHINLKDIVPGDIITMIDENNDSVRDHILVIDQVDYQNFIPFEIHYSHAVAYPEDGIYGSGIKQGMIQITDPNKKLVEQKWLEDGKENDNYRIYLRAQKSRTELRHFHWF